MVACIGDDCVAIKPQSFNIRLQNLTCIGGNGVAIGSLGQVCKFILPAGRYIYELEKLNPDAIVPERQFRRQRLG